MTTTQRPLIILSLPNSGTTWLATTIAKHRPGRYYDEYFNPVLNHRHQVKLRRVFGSELACCYRNIARGDGPEVDEVIRETWCRDEYSFTKENYSPFKLRSFVRHFEVVVLLRHTAGVFPPSRGRVWSFYEHSWQALKDAGHEMVEVSLRARAMEAHALMARELRRSADELQVPIIYYEDLFNDTLMHESLRRAGLDQPAIVADISRTRREKRIQWDAVY